MQSQRLFFLFSWIFSLVSYAADREDMESAEEEPFEEWCKKLDLNNFPDPLGLWGTIHPSHLESEWHFKRFWWNETGLKIIKFNRFTPYPWSLSSSESDDDNQSPEDSLYTLQHEK